MGYVRKRQYQYWPPLSSSAGVSSIIRLSDLVSPLGLLHVF